MATTDIVDELAKLEHKFRNAVEGEYEANLLQKARFEIEALRKALANAN